MAPINHTHNTIGHIKSNSLGMARTVQKRQDGVGKAGIGAASSSGASSIHPNIQSQSISSPSTPPLSQSISQFHPNSHSKENQDCSPLANNNNNNFKTGSRSRSRNSFMNLPLTLSRNNSNSNLNSFLLEGSNESMLMNGSSFPPTPPSTNTATIPLPSSIQSSQSQSQSPSPRKSTNRSFSVTPSKKVFRKRHRTRESPIKQSGEGSGSGNGNGRAEDGAGDGVVESNNYEMTPSNSKSLLSNLMKSGKVDYTSPNPRPRARKRVEAREQVQPDAVAQDQTDGNANQLHYQLDNHAQFQGNETGSQVEKNGKSKINIKSKRIISSGNYRPNKEDQDFSSASSEGDNGKSKDFDDSFMAENHGLSNVNEMIVKERFLPQVWEFAKPRNSEASSFRMKKGENPSDLSVALNEEGNESQMEIPEDGDSSLLNIDRDQPIPESSTPVVNNSLIPSKAKGKRKSRSSLSNEITENSLKTTKRKPRPTISGAIQSTVPKPKRSRKSQPKDVNSSTPMISNSSKKAPKTEPSKKNLRKSLLSSTVDGSKSRKSIGAGRRSFGIIVKPEIGEATLERAVQPESPGDDPLLIKASERERRELEERERRRRERRSRSRAAEEKEDEGEVGMEEEGEVDAGDQSFDGTRFQGRMKGKGKMLGEFEGGLMGEFEDQEIKGEDQDEEVDYQHQFQDGIDFFDGSEVPESFDFSGGNGDDDSQDEEEELKPQVEDSLQEENPDAQGLQNQEEDGSREQVQSDSLEVSDLLNQESRNSETSGEVQVEEEEPEFMEQEELEEEEEFDDDEDEEDEVIILRGSGSASPPPQAYSGSTTSNLVDQDISASHPNPEDSGEVSQDALDQSSGDEEEEVSLQEEPFESQVRDQIETQTQTQAERDAEAREGEEASFSYIQTPEVEEDETFSQGSQDISDSQEVEKEQLEAEVEEEVDGSRSQENLDEEEEDEEEIQDQDLSMQQLEEDQVPQLEEAEQSLLEEEEEEENPDESMQDILSSEASMRDIAEAAARADGDEVDQSLFVQPGFEDEDEEDEEEEVDQEEENQESEDDQEGHETQEAEEDEIDSSLTSPSINVQGKMRAISPASDSEVGEEEPENQSARPQEPSRDLIYLHGNDRSISRIELHRRISNNDLRNPNESLEDEESGEEGEFEISMNQTTKNISISVNPSYHAESSSRSISRSKSRGRQSEGTSISRSHNSSRGIPRGGRQILEISSLDPRETARAVAALKSAGYYDEGWMTSDGGNWGNLTQAEDEDEEEQFESSRSFPVMVRNEQKKQASKKRQREEIPSETPLKASSSLSIQATPICPGAFPRSPALAQQSQQQGSSSSAQEQERVFKSSNVWDKCSWAALDRAFTKHVQLQARDLVSSSIAEGMDKYEARKLVAMQLVNNQDSSMEIWKMFKEENGIEEKDCKDLWARRTFPARIRALSLTFLDRLNRRHPGVISEVEWSSLGDAHSLTGSLASLNHSSSLSSIAVKKSVSEPRTEHNLKVPGIGLGLGNFGSVTNKLTSRLSFGSPFRNGTHSTPVPPSKSRQNGHSDSKVNQLKKTQASNQDDEEDDEEVERSLDETMFRPRAGMVSNLLNRAKRMSGVFSENSTATSASSANLRKEKAPIREMESISSSIQSISKIYPSLPHSSSSSSLKRGHASMNNSSSIPPPPPPPAPTSNDLAQASRSLVVSRVSIDQASASFSKDTSSSFSKSITSGRNSNSFSFEEILQGRKNLKKSGGSTEKSAGEREISKIDLDKLEKSKLEKERRKSAQHVPSGSTGLVKKRISDANASFVASSPMLALTSNLNSSGRMQVSSSSFIAPTVLAGFSPSSHQKADALRETMKQSRTGRDWKSPSKRVYGKVISRGSESESGIGGRDRGDQSFEGSRSFWRGRESSKANEENEEI